MPNTHMTQY